MKTLGVGVSEAGVHYGDHLGKFAQWFDPMWRPGWKTRATATAALSLSAVATVLAPVVGGACLAASILAVEGLRTNRFTFGEQVADPADVSEC